MKKISTVARRGNEIFKEPKLTIGLDLGDRASHYCILDEAGKAILERTACLRHRRESIKSSAGSRQSGRTFSLPVVIAVVEGQRYLVSMLGENVNWVQNVRAADGKAVLRSGGREPVQLEEVPADQRAPGARPHVPVNKDAPLAEFEKIASAFPVFRVATPSA